MKNRLQIAVFFILPFFYNLYCQQDRFYTPYNGLSSTSFNAIYQDNEGFLWIATQKGLNKFDGHSFVEYQHNPLDTTSLDNSAVLSIFQDSKGTLWVGTEYGLHIFNKKTNNFKRYPLFLNNSLLFIQITSIIEDKSGFLWLTTSHGLVKFNAQNNTVIFFNKEKIRDPYLDRYLMNAALFDDSGNLWIASDKNGLFCYNPVSNEFKNYRYDPGKNSVCDNSILSLGKDTEGNIIIGTIKGGISIYNIKKQLFTSIPLNHKPGNVFNGGVYSIVTDKRGSVWIGTERNGLKSLNTATNTLSDINALIKVNNIEDSKIHCFLDKENNLWLAIDYNGIYLKKGTAKPFYSLSKNINSNLSLSNNIVKSILQDKSGNLWIGTDGGGLNYIPQNKSSVTYYLNNPDKPGSIPDNAIIALFEDDKQNLWIGSYLGGLSLFNKKTNTFKTYLIDPLRKGRDFNFVTSIISDRNQNLWISTNGGGLHHFNTKTNLFTRISNITINNVNIQLPAFLTTLLLDNDGTLWMGSYNGLYCWNPKKGIYASFTAGNGSMENENINTLYEKDNNIWFGTSSGLYSIDKNTHKIANYTVADELSNNSVFGILEDNKENLWISTLNGISKFNPNTKTFRNYFSYDGLPGNEFRPASSFKADNGLLYFGSTLGVVYFYPDSIREISTFPTLELTNFRIYNTIIPIGEKIDNRTILKQSINETKNITLRFSDKNFTIDFVAIEYNAPEKIKYAFILEGFDQKWNYRDYNQRYATYTNLNPGTYTFKIKTTNSDGLWNKNIKTITFHIKPPFWKTWWAYLLYTILIMSILYVTRQLIVFRIQMQNKLEIEQLEREKLEELNQSKMQFFSNVSHEFRTPLTLILGPIERMLYSKTDSNSKKQLEFVHRNALRLLRLVNLLLDLQKVEKNEMHLNAQLGDIVGFTKEIAYTFNELAQHKKITLTFNSGTEKLDAWFDSDKLDKVLFNILSNAIKFTPKGGEIHVNLTLAKIGSGPDPEKEFIQISISDTGKGIKEEYLNKIFNRFYQVENQETDEIQIGTGIGLHLTKYLVDLHKGRINVTSKVGEGTRFDIYLPLGSEHIDIKQKTTESVILSETKNMELTDLTPLENIQQEDIKHNTPTKKTHKSHKILVVEDDYDVRTYIKSELGEFYDIYEAMDGIDAWAVIKDKMPDLVISDVMMPRMDGIQLCKKIKTEINTSHIPVILLTARTSIENRMEGLETGADSYIPKPFHPQHLKIRVEKLIELRTNLINKFSKSVSFEASEVTLTSADEKFLQKAINLVKENIANSELNIEDMSSDLGMSRVHLYRKLKALTNQTPNEFVRTIRLKQAAAFLSQNKLNVSEIAYSVGFSSHQYFSNCFQNYFNMSPTEYVQKTKENSVE